MISALVCLLWEYERHIQNSVFSVLLEITSSHSNYKEAPNARI